MEVYRSGHNEAVLKTVWVKAPGGSNPSTSAKKIYAQWRRFFLLAEECDHLGLALAPTEKSHLGVSVVSPLSQLATPF